MPVVRLIREVLAPDGRGPGNGQCALQKLLQAAAIPGLEIGGTWEPGEIPWVWSWEDVWLAVRCAVRGEPFIVGPNVLFGNSRNPGQQWHERAICEAASCRLLFTESAWYADLIRAQLGELNRAPIVVWPYPIDPLPDAPVEPQYDLLIYSKSGHSRGLVRQLGQAFPRNRTIIYGRYRREEMIEAARRSRCCAYLSDDDRGPLALAEILLAGCPAVGVPRGAPWIEPGITGALAASLVLPDLRTAIERAQVIPHAAVRAWALDQFSGPMTVGIIRQSLEGLK